MSPPRQHFDHEFDQAEEEEKIADKQDPVTYRNSNHRESRESRNSENTENPEEEFENQEQEHDDSD